jgi:hypothetical protein
MGLEPEPQAKADNPKSRAMLAGVIKARAVDALARAKIVETNYGGLKSSLQKTRQKRGIIDGRGKVLNWFFGVSTTDELETVSRRVDRLSTEESAIVQELEAHTTLINETFWEVKASLETMETLRRTCVALDKEVAGLGQASSNFAGKMWWKWQTRDKIDSAFKAVSLTLAWLEDFSTRLSVGLVAAAMERLCPTLFPPAQLNKALEEIKSKLPTGWSLTPAFQAGEMWKAYEEARVVAATVAGGVRLFIHLPVFEFQLSFNFYRVIGLPRTAANDSVAVRYVELPDYLAVATDRQTFIEMTAAETSQCRQDTTVVCPINRAIEKKSYGKPASRRSSWKTTNRSARNAPRLRPPGRVR